MSQLQVTFYFTLFIFVIPFSEGQSIDCFFCRYPDTDPNNPQNCDVPLPSTPIRNAQGYNNPHCYSLTGNLNGTYFGYRAVTGYGTDPKYTEGQCVDGLPENPQIEGLVDVVTCYCKLSSRCNFKAFDGGATSVNLEKIILALILVTTLI